MLDAARLVAPALLPACSYMRAYRSICPDEWIEKWQELRESGEQDWRRESREAHAQPACLQPESMPVLPD